MQHIIENNFMLFYKCFDIDCFLNKKSEYAQINFKELSAHRGIIPKEKADKPKTV